MSTFTKAARRPILVAEALEARLTPSGTKPMAVIMPAAGGGGGGTGGPVGSVVTVTQTHTVTVSNTATNTYDPTGKLIGQSFSNDLSRVGSVEVATQENGADANGNSVATNTDDLSQKVQMVHSDSGWNVDPSTGTFQSNSSNSASTDNLRDVKADQLTTDQGGNTQENQSELVADKFNFSASSNSFSDDGMSLNWSGTSDSGTSNYRSFQESTTFSDLAGDAITFSDGSQSSSGNSAHSEYQDSYNYWTGVESDSSYSNTDRSNSLVGNTGVAVTDGNTGVTWSAVDTQGGASDVLHENYSSFNADSFGYSWSIDSLTTRTDVGYNAHVTDVTDPTAGTVTETGRSHTTTDTNVRESGSNGSNDYGTGVNTSGTSGGQSQSHQEVDQYWKEVSPYYEYQDPYAQQLV